MSLSVILAFLCLVKTFIEVKPHFFRSNVVVPGTFVDMVRYNFLMCSGSVQPSPEIAVSHGHVNCNKSSLRADKRTVRRLPFFFLALQLSLANGQGVLGGKHMPQSTDSIAVLTPRPTVCLPTSGSRL